MKKISWLLLVGLLALFSCEQEELDAIAKVDVNQPKTKAATSIADFDPIAELADIPVNIMNVGNTRYKYLSCVKSGTLVDLYDEDGGNGRQWWYIRGGMSF